MSAVPIAADFGLKSSPCNVDALHEDVDAALLQEDRSAVLEKVALPYHILGLREKYGLETALAIFPVRFKEKSVFPDMSACT